MKTKDNIKKYPTYSIFFFTLLFILISISIILPKNAIGIIYFNIIFTITLTVMLVTFIYKISTDTTLQRVIFGATPTPEHYLSESELNILIGKERA